MKENKKSVSTRRALSHCKASKEKQEDFIMLPTVDFCFKELMQNDNIRKNIMTGSGFQDNGPLRPGRSVIVAYGWLWHDFYLILPVRRYRLQQVQYQQSG